MSGHQSPGWERIVAWLVVGAVSVNSWLSVAASAAGPRGAGGDLRGGALGAFPHPQVLRADVNPTLDRPTAGRDNGRLRF